MRIAITGGAGFLGYHLAGALVSRGHDIVLLDIAPIEPAEYPPDVRFERTDVRAREDVHAAFGSVDAVIHAAAALPLWKRADIYDINVWGTLHVLEAAVRRKLDRVVYVSSTAVYGVPEKHPLEETDPLIGVGAYGESKIQAERLCESFRRMGLTVSIIRPKTFIGTGRLGVFQILYDWVQSGKRIPIIGAGHNRYQLLEVTDLVAAILLLLEGQASKVNDTFNVGATRFSTVKEFVGDLCAYAANGARVQPTPARIVKGVLAGLEAAHLSPLYKWIYGTADKDSYVTSEKIEHALGWQPRYSNSDALIRSYQWYLEHQGEIVQGTGATHRIAWDQGALKIFKRWL
jgi:nucleoside-diphosphate-sugar epimerase